MTAYGGRDAYVFAPSQNPVLQHYQRTSLGNETSGSSTRAASFTSVADVPIPAHSTSPIPVSSRKLSLGQCGAGVGEGLRMTLAPVAQFNDHPSQSSLSTTTQSPSDDKILKSVKNTQEPMPSRSSTLTPMQRIKSLTNFHLYLSPSRLAQVDLLSDSSDGESNRRIGRRPAVIANRPLQSDHITRPDLRSRPPLRIHGIPSHLTSDQQVRSYSGQLQLHHAQRLEELDNQAPIPPHPAESQFVETVAETESRGPPVDSSTEGARPISAYSRSSNPWFGYPAILIPDVSHPGSVLIRPRYRRNRKRDLVKTLIFLFVLRLQSWRDIVERTLGLHRRGLWHLRDYEAKNPSEGLVMSASSRTMLISRSRVLSKDWIWMVMGFFLLRGTWTRVLAAPLQALDLKLIRDLLGFK